MIVLVAGGRASGKFTVCNAIANMIAQETLRVKVQLFDMDEYQNSRYKPGIDVDKIIQDALVADPGVLLVYGDYALYHESLRNIASLKVFVDTDSDEQLSQWILRDKDHCELDAILNEYLNHAKPAFVKYIEKTKQFADVLLPRGADSMGLKVISMNIVDRSREDFEEGTPQIRKIDLRRELWEQNEERYYGTV